jgi:Tfp pilus assembly protein PilF
MAAVWLALALAGCGDGRRAERIASACREPDASCGQVVFQAPLGGSVFPPDMAAPKFVWRHTAKAPPDVYLMTFTFGAAAEERVLVYGQEWTPPPRLWRTVREKAGARAFSVAAVGVDARDRVLAAGEIPGLAFSPDAVGAPIFYREVNLPFAEAVKDPTRIRWRLGAVSSERQPPVVLEKLPVCGNCHSFSKDGTVFGMDVDYANDKGSYVTAEVAREMALTPDAVFSWSAFRREDGEQTFGLLAQVSPDGRYVVSTVKDRSVFLPMPGLEFSQLFFPLKGILAVYDRQTGEIRALPGADDPDYVQSNPAWSPDGRTIAFARSRAYKLKSAARGDAVMLRREECKEFLEEGLTFTYDVYTVPFNGGAGGEARPLAGASGDGRSNFFARYSPDGRWIVFCKAASFMLLQPDSELYIVPAEGGEARRLGCNLPRMNSWHSWAPGGRWLVFASKHGSPYTRLFLSHIDGAGNASPAVWLDRFTDAGRAANIPEFVAMEADAIRRIRERFLDDTSFVRAGNALRDGGEPGRALEQYRRALGVNAANTDARVNMGAALCDLGRFPEAEACLREAVAKAPHFAMGWYNLSVLNARQGNIDEALRCCTEAVRLNPRSAEAQSNLGIFLYSKGRLDEAKKHLNAAIRIDPHKANTHLYLGRLLAKQGDAAGAERHLAEARRLEKK